MLIVKQNSTGCSFFFLGRILFVVQICAIYTSNRENKNFSNINKPGQVQENRMLEIATRFYFYQTQHNSDEAYYIVFSKLNFAFAYIHAYTYIHKHAWFCVPLSKSYLKPTDLTGITIIFFLS